MFFALAPVRLAGFPGRIVARIKLRKGAARPLAHLFPGERQHFGVARRSPRKSVDAIESEHVIDAKDVKDFAHAAHPPPPPIQVSRSHHVPAVKRNAPILSPFLGERVVLEVWLRRSDTRTVDR